MSKIHFEVTKEFNGKFFREGPASIQRIGFEESVAADVVNKLFADFTTTLNENTNLRLVVRLETIEDCENDSGEPQID